MEELLKKLLECISPLTIITCICLLVRTGCYFVRTCLMFTFLDDNEDNKDKMLKKIADRLGIKDGD